MSNIIEELATSLFNSYEHIQHKDYNDALSSILEAQEKMKALLDKLEAQQNKIERLEKVAAETELFIAGKTYSILPMTEALAKLGEGKCEHGKGLTDYCLECGRVNGG